MKFGSGNILFGASAIAIAASVFVAPAFAQDEAGIEASEIVVTARRKDERLQDVPLTVNAASAEDLNKLSIRKFDDVAAIMPGLNMQQDAKGYAPTTTVRGINYDTNASGTNGTVEFYLNDAPTSAGALFQTMYDMGQVELLRGPQGTLRGRASPSGSMTVTTHRVNLSELGGYVSGTATDIGGLNASGALNIPLISDVLAVRVAALVDENEGNRVRSVNNGTKPYSRTTSGRLSVRFEPTSNLKFDFMYQKMIQKSHSYDQVMRNGNTLANGGLIDNPILPGTQYGGTMVDIAANDRLAVEDNPRDLRQEYHILNWQGEWAFAGQKLNYVGSFWRQKVFVADSTGSGGEADTGDFFGPNYLGAGPAAATPVFPGFIPMSPITNVNSYAYYTFSQARNYSHELRLSSEEPLFGKVDYIVGGFLQNLTPPTDLMQPNILGAATPGGYYQNIQRRGHTKEKSLFANLTYHLGEATEVSGGVRYINFESAGYLKIPLYGQAFNCAAASATPLLWETICPLGVQTENKGYNAVIYSASLKHRFSDDFMAYASVGSSWRPGITAVGDFNGAYMKPNERLFTELDPEKSTSYEIGFKSSLMNKRIRLNVTAYHQDFKNYPYRSSTGIYYGKLGSSGFSLGTFNFVSAVPVKVDGVEAETTIQATRNWSIGGNFSYSKGKIKNGLIPCNDYSGGQDGIGDTDGYVPTVDPMTGLVDGYPGPTGCNVNMRSSNAPLWSATIQSEYSHPITESMTGYLRGMAQIYGKSQNDPTNAIDDYASYALLNLYAGIRDPKGAWELSVYGKNVTKTKRIMSRMPLRMGTSAGIYNTAYDGITYTAPREFGVNLRYAFGSR